MHSNRTHSALVGIDLVHHCLFHQIPEAYKPYMATACNKATAVHQMDDVRRLQTWYGRASFIRRTDSVLSVCHAQNKKLRDMS